MYLGQTRCYKNPFTHCSLFILRFLAYLTLSNFLQSDAHHLETAQYSELKQLNADCYPLDSCKESHENDTLEYKNCNCGMFCVEYNTCCLDSEFMGYEPINKVDYNCVEVYGSSPRRHLYMVDRCPPDWTGGDHIRDLCIGNAEELNAPMLVIPVTNTVTGYTYRNYFCAVCNDKANVQHSIYWDLKLMSNSHQIFESDVSKLYYNTELLAWMLRNVGQDQDDDVTVQVQVPYHVEPVVKACRSDVRAECASDWPDDDTRRKCGSYTAIITVVVQNDVFNYKNVHCAVCNNHVDFKVVCSMSKMIAYGGPGQKPLSFALLLDVNQSGGNVVGEIKKCNDKQVYDPVFKKCRKLKCAVPGYVIKDGVCTNQ